MGKALSAPIVATRRGVLGALMIAPAAGAALALPAASMHGDTPFRRLLAATIAADARFDALPDDLERTNLALFHAEERRLHAATDALFEAEPKSWADFVEWLDRFHGVNDERTMRHARRLLASSSQLH